jgi:Tol biopolymer transport system component
LHFNLESDAQIDAVRFFDLVEKSKVSQKNIHLLEEAISIYRGEFLEGFRIGNSRVFDEWVTIKREQNHRQALIASQDLSRHYQASGDYERALSSAWRVVELEPWREQAHRHLMRLLAQSGQREAALVQYESCQQILARELDIEPSQQTVELYNQIREGGFDATGRDLNKIPGKDRIADEEPEPTTDEVTDLADDPNTTKFISENYLSWYPRQRGRWLELISRIGSKRFWIITSGILFVLLIGLGLRFAVNNIFADTGKRAEYLPTTTGWSNGLILDVCKGLIDQLCIYESISGNHKPITPPGKFSEINPLASWSPDGKQGVFGASLKNEVTGMKDFDLYIVNIEDQSLQQITSGPGNDVMPAWSSDGEWIAFQRECQLWIIRPDGSDAQALLDTKGESCFMGITWSPENQQIAFLKTGVGPSSTLPAELAVVDRDGADYQRITVPEENIVNGILAWSPDSRYIACMCLSRQSGQEVFLLFDLERDGESQLIDRLPDEWFHAFWPGGGGKQ